MVLGTGTLPFSIQLPFLHLYIDIRQKTLWMKPWIYAACILLILAAGCVSEEPAGESGVGPTVSPPATESDENSIIPTLNTPPHPDALAVGEVFSYGGETEAREISISNDALLDSYQIHHPDWGFNYGIISPPNGSRFLFVFIRVEHKGTEKELGAPYPASIIVEYDWDYYFYRTERVGTVTKVLNFSGYQDYYGGIIRTYEVREGFLIYEVPADIELKRAYVLINLGNDRIPVWRLG
jgi:hypothetical protein